MGQRERPSRLVSPLLEASACAVPVVAFDVGGVSDVVVHNETGILVREPSVENLLKAIDRLVADPVEREALGRAGRERVINNFTLTHQADAWGRLPEEDMLAVPPADGNCEGIRERGRFWIARGSILGWLKRRIQFFAAFLVFSAQIASLSGCFRRNSHPLCTFANSSGVTIFCGWSRGR